MDEPVENEKYEYTEEYMCICECVENNAAPFIMWKIDSWRDKEDWDLLQMMSKGMKAGVDIWEWQYLLGEYKNHHKENEKKDIKFGDKSFRVLILFCNYGTFHRRGIVWSVSVSRLLSVIYSIFSTQGNGGDLQCQKRGRYLTWR